MNAHSSSAKGCAPLGGEAVAHDRLFPLLQRTKGGAVWIHGPAGFGKSTLAAHFVHASAQPYLWYRIDAGDADLGWQFAELGKALRATLKFPVRHLPAMAPLLAGSPHYAAAFFWRSVAAQLPASMTIVFDEAEVLPVDSSGLIGLAVACAELPAGVTILFTSRVEEPPVFARLAVNGRLTRIGPDALRFTKTETRALLALKSCATDAAAVDAVFASTQGWPGAVALLAHYGTGLASLSANSVAQVGTLRKYLEAEVMYSVPERFRHDLALASTTDTTSAASARCLTGSDTILEQLGTMVEGGFFVTRLEGPHPVYRVHPLLRDFLQHKLRQDLASDDYSALLLRAGQFLVGSDALPEAVELMHRAGAVDEICQVIEAAAGRLLDAGQSTTLRSWLALVPSAVRANRPWLAYWEASTLMTSDPARSKELMATVFRLFQSPFDPTGRALAWAGSVDAIFMEYAALSELDTWLDCFDVEISQLLQSLAPPAAAKVTIAHFTAMAFRRPASRTLGAARENVHRLLLDSPMPALAGAARTQLFIHALWGGDIAGATHQLEVIRELSRLPSGAPSTRLLAQVLALSNSLFVGELKACEGQAVSCLQLADEIGAHLWDAIVWGHRVCAMVGQGHYGEATSHMPQWRASLTIEVHHQMSRYRAVAAFLAAKAHDEQGARGFCARALASAEWGGAPTFQAIGKVTVAAALLELNRNDSAADSMLQEVLEFGHTTNPMLHWMALLMSAGLAAQRGSDSAAKLHSENAFKLGARQGYWHFAFWPRDLVTSACEVAIRLRIEPEYAAKLISRNDLHPSTLGYHLDAWPWRVKIRTLGRFAIFLDDRALVFSGKTPTMPLRLLQALIALGGREVREQRLCDRLWPDAEGDAAASSLGVTLHRLRHLLKIDCITRREGKLSLDSKVAWTDVWAFERALSDPSAAQRLALSDLRSLYQGDFLQDQDDASWIWAMRERVKDKLVGFISGRTRHFMEVNNHADAEALLLLGLEIDDLVEDFYRGLMQCRAARGDVSAALLAFQRCERVLESRLHTRPATATVALLAEIMKSGSVDSTRPASGSSERH